MFNTRPSARATSCASSKSAAKNSPISARRSRTKPWPGSSLSEDCWQLLLAASKSDSAIERAIASGEPSHVARYAFQLAQAFSNFYHEFPVLSESDPEKKTFLLWMTDYFRAQLERTLDVLGIEVPEYM